MKFLNSERVLSNMDLLSNYVVNKRGHNSFDGYTLKEKFIDSLNYLQGTNISSYPNLKVEYNDLKASNFLYNNGVFSNQEITNGRHLLKDSDYNEYKHKIEKALIYIRQADDSLYKLINNVIGSIPIYHITDRDGGSISNSIGMIWLSPIKNWPIEYYCEMIVHEFVHNCVFLEDMVRGIMPDTDIIELEDAHVISAVRQTKRPYDKSFHSACVVIAIMYIYTVLNRNDIALTFLPSLKVTIKDLRLSYNKLEKVGFKVLSQNGEEILSEMENFIHELNYNSIKESLLIVEEEISPYSSIR